MKIVKISGCNICPFVSREKNNRYCGGVDIDDEGYGVDLAGYIDEQKYPTWCPLEDEIEN